MDEFGLFDEQHCEKSCKHGFGNYPHRVCIAKIARVVADKTLWA
jgi:hypothetical protein